MIHHSRRSSAIMVASLLTVAIVGGTSAVTAQDPSMTWPETATGVSGNLEVHGSSTVYPISNAVSEAFVEVNPDVGYVVGFEGTGDGFGNFFCVGESDISDASRAIKDSEAEICAQNGVDYAELKIGYDGIAVITSPANDLIDCLTAADLYALMGPESSGVSNWKDAQALAGELGSTTVLPDAPLSITAPGAESGTHDSFIELAFGKIPEERGQDAILRDPGSVYVASGDDNVIIEGISGFPTSLGFVGLAYVEENADRVKTIAIDEGSGCVQPSVETVASGEYPLGRPLFIYPSLNRIADNPVIQPWVDFYLSDEGIANVTDVGYVALAAAELDQTRKAWLTATGR